jgi:hypothetical protein
VGILPSIQLQRSKMRLTSARVPAVGAQHCAASRERRSGDTALSSEPSARNR